MEFRPRCIPVLEIVGAYTVVYTINAILGIFQNVFIKGDKFSFKKIFITICQMLIIAISAIGIVFAFEFISDGLNELGLNIEESLTNVISIFTFIVLFIEAFTLKAKDVYEKIKTLTGVTITIEEAKEKEIKYKKPKQEVSGNSADGISPDSFYITTNKFEGVG